MDVPNGTFSEKLGIDSTENVRYSAAQQYNSECYVTHPRRGIC